MLKQREILDRELFPCLTVFKLEQDLPDPTSKEERLSNELKKAAYATRLGHLRRGQEHAAKNEISKAVENYLTYLKALETYFSVKEENLSPKLFD